MAFFGVQRFLLGGQIDVPDSVNGIPRVTGPFAESFDQQISAAADDFDVSAQGGVYGTEAAPDFLVVVANGAAEETADELFTSMVEGMAQGGAVKSGATSAGDLDGATYRCLAATVQGIPIGTCMWVADRHVGIVLDLDGGLADVEALTADVYRAATA